LNAAGTRSAPICADRASFSKVPQTQGGSAVGSVHGLLGLAILVLDVWAIVRVMQTTATTGTKVVWIVVILLLPVLGPLLWYLFGPK
jgi:Phospholipase_D-nuclease N-terminal